MQVVEQLRPVVAVEVGDRLALDDNAAAAHKVEPESGLHFHAVAARVNHDFVDVLNAAHRHHCITDYCATNGLKANLFASTTIQRQAFSSNKNHIFFLSSPVVLCRYKKTRTRRGSNCRCAPKIQVALLCD